MFSSFLNLQKHLNRGCVWGAFVAGEEVWAAQIFFFFLMVESTYSLRNIFFLFSPPFFFFLSLHMLSVVITVRVPENSGRSVVIISFLGFCHSDRKGAFSGSVRTGSGS